MRTIRSAIVGCGAIAPNHVDALKMIEGAELVAVCDVVEERATALAEKTGARAYTSLEALLEKEEVDLVHVCVPSGNHAQVGIIAANAGKHVVVEKPIDVTLDAADSLIRACAQNGVVLSCISQHRFDPDVVTVKKAVDEGRLGPVHYGCSHTKWYRSQEYYDSGDWRGTWRLDGGGALMNQSVHYVDLLQHLCGEIEEVYAYCATRAHVRIEVEDCAAVAVKFKSGAIGLIEGNTTAYPGFVTRLDVFGQQGGAIIENDRLREWRVGDEVWTAEKGGDITGRVQDEFDVSNAGTSTAVLGKTSHVRQLKDIVEAIRENRKPLVTGEEGRIPLAVILAIYESARTGKPVRIADLG